MLMYSKVLSLFLVHSICRTRSFSNIRNKVSHNLGIRIVVGETRMVVGKTKGETTIKRKVVIKVVKINKNRVKVLGLIGLWKGYCMAQTYLRLMRRGKN